MLLCGHPWMTYTTEITSSGKQLEFTLKYIWTGIMVDIPMLELATDASCWIRHPWKDPADNGTIHFAIKSTGIFVKRGPRPATPSNQHKKYAEFTVRKKYFYKWTGINKYFWSCNYESLPFKFNIHTTTPDRWPFCINIGYGNKFIIHYLINYARIIISARHHF